MTTTGPKYFDPSWIRTSDETLRADVAVYGGTSAGVIAAVKATQLGMSAVLLQPGLHLGGMTTGGLGWTDAGKESVIGGMARGFYRALGALDGRDETWHFEPSKAQRVMDGLLEGSGVVVRLAAFLDRVQMDGRRLKSITMLGGLRVEARIFIDATYEGDLLAKAGVSCHIGRESNQAYGESLNGVQVRDKHQFAPATVDPYVRPGDPASGLLPHVEAIDLRPQQGQGDRRVQAYNFRVCMTDDPALKIDWRRPEGFDDAEYELARRWYNSDKDANNEGLVDWGAGIRKFDVLENKTPAGFGKTDTNNHGPVSSDFIGANWDWPEASYAQREAIFQEHVTYQQGLYWVMANDPAIPQRYRERYGRWGLARDEFADTAHWPHQLYVREARRMVSDYVITEADCMRPNGFRPPPDSVGMGSYTLDSHNCTRFVATIDGKPVVLNDGDVQVPPTDPYPISYRAVVPRQGECDNLLVPVCISASHIAFGSARMEPVFMVLAESAAAAASLAIRLDVPVQAVPYARLRSMLDEAKQVLE